MSPPAGMGSTQTVYPDAPPFNPLSLNPSLWLDAMVGVHDDGTGRCDVWHDQSGNFRDFVQAGPGNNRPLITTNGLNGRPSLNFTDVITSQGMNMQDPVAPSEWGHIITSSAFTFFIVWQFHNLFGSVNNLTDPRTSPNLLTDWDPAGPWQGTCTGQKIGDPTLVETSTFAWNGAAWVFVNQTGPIGNAHYTTHQFDQVSGNLSIQFEQSAVITQALGGAGNLGAGNLAATPVGIARNVRSTSGDLVGEMSEIFVTNTVVSPANQLNMQNYLKAKWGF
jgi:hypothetical protein